jgi:hypothetical protein
MRRSEFGDDLVGTTEPGLWRKIVDLPYAMPPALQVAETSGPRGFRFMHVNSNREIMRRALSFSVNTPV